MECEDSRTGACERSAERKSRSTKAS